MVLELIGKIIAEKFFGYYLDKAKSSLRESQMIEAFEKSCEYVVANEGSDLFDQITIQAISSTDGVRDAESLWSKLEQSFSESKFPDNQELLEILVNCWKARKNQLGSTEAAHFFTLSEDSVRPVIQKIADTFFTELTQIPRFSNPYIINGLHRQQHLPQELAAALVLAKRANTEWLSDAFSSRKRARTKLGQPLSPGEVGTANVLQRKTLMDDLHPYLTVVPDEEVVCILGDEGNGKSWIVAQSWLTLEHKSLMVFLFPEDFAEAARQNNFTDLLISKLIEQTGDRDNATTQELWSRMLGLWRSQPVTDSPRIIVVIDGINQRPKSDWARIIESIGDELDQIGGRLIVTVRSAYFRDRVKGRLSVLYTEISISEWTITERDEILTEYGIKSSDLHQDVARSLRNPRLLGIALELLNKSDISNFDELSISRLLFEHMRMSERDAPVPQTAQEFARILREHAKEILLRINSKQQDDLKIFEYGMRAVSDGRFYQTLDGDPTRYTLIDDGLTLALGFAMIDRLRTAKRNDRDLDAELDVILEPITALDDTADVIIAALTVNTTTDHYEQDIATSLAKGFAALQNPDQSKFSAFLGLAKRRPQGFVDAAYVLSLAGGNQPNFDWLQDAIIAVGKNKLAWLEISDKVHSWLSVYSLSPDRGIFAHPARDPHDKIKEEHKKNRKKIEERLRSLSGNERVILENLQEEDGDLSRLSRLALLLLAGKPLAPFAKSLLNWCFSTALNSDLREPYDDFIHLVSLNEIDWVQTRAALLKTSAALGETEVSTTGKWALVSILRATGHSDDGKEAQSLVEGLTKDRPTFGGVRLLERYCATDPCDPASEEPKNVTSTAKEYAAIDVSKLQQDRGQSSEDNFFDMAGPCIARFKPKVAIAKYREFVADVLKRIGFPLRQGLLELHRHNALLTNREALELIKKWHEIKTAGTDVTNLPETEAWIVSQYLLLLAFPFLSSQDQAQILLSDEADENNMIKLLKLSKPLSQAEFETLLRSACAENNKRNQFLLLELAKFSYVELTKNASAYVKILFQSKTGLMRGLALDVIAQSGDTDMISMVVKSGWKAIDTETDKDLECWVGSVALLEGAARGLIAHEEVLNRISSRLYGRAAAMLDANAVHDIAFRIDACIRHAVDLNSNLMAPDIEIQVNPSDPLERSLPSLSERSSQDKDIEDTLKLLSEDSQDFEQRQRCNYEVFLKFKSSLSQEKALIILQHISLEEFATIVAVDEGFADPWYELFMNIAEAKLPAIHNLVLLLAHALMENAPNKAKNLFRLVESSRPLVRFTFSGAGVQLDAMAAWAGVRSPILDELRFNRLGSAGNDHDLSLEVLAALLNGKQELLAEYIQKKLCKEEPAEISRGLMVAGFSDRSKFNDETLKEHEDTAGLIGSAQKSANYAYERNCWARHWFKKMCQANEHSDFWRYSRIFTKIVDGRFAVWHSEYEQQNYSTQSFRQSINDMIENRYKRWASHRNKKLFGLNVPNSIFLKKVSANN